MYTIIPLCLDIAWIVLKNNNVDFLCTWFPSPGSVLHEELDAGGSADRELIVKVLNLEARIVT